MAPDMLSDRSPRARTRTARRYPEPVEDRAHPPAGLLHRLSRSGRSSRRMKLVEKEAGQASDRRRYRLPSVLDHAALRDRRDDHGLWPGAGLQLGLQCRGGERGRSAIIGDGGFWHNGLASSFGNMVFNKQDGVLLVVDNHYSAATGGQDILSSRADNKRRKHQASDRGCGGGHWRAPGCAQVDRTYDVGKMRDALREALTTDEKGPKVIVASSECMLNRQRREKPLARQGDQGRQARGRKPRFGVDEDICTGDHACIRLSGCPSLSVKKLDDPLRDDPVAAIDTVLRRLRQLRRGRRCGGPLPVLLSRRCRAQSELARTHTGEVARARSIGWLQARRAARRLALVVMTRSARP